MPVLKKEAKLEGNYKYSTLKGIVRLPYSYSNEHILFQGQKKESHNAKGTYAVTWISWARSRVTLQ